jgi:hypothetical protein
MGQHRNATRCARASILLFKVPKRFIFDQLTFSFVKVLQFFIVSQWRARAASSQSSPFLDSPVGVAVGGDQNVSIVRDIGVESDHHTGGLPDLRGDSRDLGVTQDSVFVF